MKRKSSKKRREKAPRKHARAGTHRDAAGRLHLSLERDPLSGHELVTLLSPLFKEAWQNDVTAATANTARAVLTSQPSVQRTVELARNVMAATSRLAEGLLARAPAGAVACKAGCDHCCYQVVGVTVPEALAILDHLKTTRSEPELARFTEHVIALHEKGRGLPSAERFSPEHPCAFLESGRCSIYEARPLSCRGMNSLDAGECATRLRDPEARAAFLADGTGGHSFMEPIRAFHAVSAGLQLALAELYQLDMRPLELIGAMRLLLTGPASLPSEWIAGGAPFESALSKDHSSDPRMRELSGALAQEPLAEP